MNNQCALCYSEDTLSEYEVTGTQTASITLCDTCKGQIEGTSELTVNHWHCLNDSAWTDVPAEQVMVYRMLKKLSTEAWAQDLIEQIYLDEETLAWAESEDEETAGDVKPTVDSNGTVLNDGDSVTLIRDLDVKGTTFIAKRGTIVKNISLTTNPEHIEGRINKAKLVLKTCFMKKA